MNRLSAYLDRRYALPFNPRQPKCEYFDVAQWGKRGRFTGLVIDDQVVVLDWKTLGSFRIRLSNMVTVGPCSIYRPSAGPPFPKDYVEAYLAANHDNPFGLWNVVKAVIVPKPIAANHAPPNHLTQFPPLTYSKNTQNAALDTMLQEAWAGDMICTFDRGSGLSNLIRRLDWGMWSHCCTYTGDRTLVEWTTSGCVESSFDRLRSENLDVGLYRPKIDDIDEDKRREFGRVVVKHARTQVGIPGYAWGLVIRLALAKNHRWLRRWLLRGLPSDAVTPADLMYANSFQMVCYA